MKDTHVTKITINKSFPKVWEYISNPLTYSQIYPFWLSEVKKIKNNFYEGKGPHGEYKFERVIDKNFGIVDLKIGNELSRTRIYPLDKDSTVVIHLGVRWGIMKNPLFWFFYKRDVNKDFKNAKKIIERSG